MTKNGDKYVNWRVFTWIVSMIVVALGGIFSLILVLKGDMGFVKNEIGHINKSMEEISKKLTAGIGMVVPEDADFRDKIFTDEPAGPRLHGPVTYDSKHATPADIAEMASTTAP